CWVGRRRRRYEGMKIALVAVALLAACDHDHSLGSSGAGEIDGVSVTAVRARITTDVREKRLEDRLNEAKPDCKSIRWEAGKPVCARDGSEMIAVALREGESALCCPQEGIYWYCKSGLWLGPMDAGLSARGHWLEWMVYGETRDAG